MFPAFPRHDGAGRTSPGGPLVTSRAELDALHAHLVSVHGLLDAHAA
ncbi:DUF6238 family protein, partial [Streptomyces sp. NPDC005951]